MREIDELHEQVRSNSSVAGSAATLIRGFAGRLDAILLANDVRASVVAFRAEIKASGDDLANAFGGKVDAPYLLKAGATGDPDPRLETGLLIAAAVFKGWLQQLVVTSLRDGQHMAGSLHPRGLAADLRTSALGVYVSCVAKQLTLRLGAAFQVIVEKDHIHVEYDPKRDGGRSLT